MEYSDSLANFLKLVTERSIRHFAKNYPTLTPPTYMVIHGRKYDRVISDDGQRSAYCWIDTATGGIMKGSWKAVEDKRPRGNIFDADPLKGTNIYGVDYLNIDNSRFQEVK